MRKRIARILEKRSGYITAFVLITILYFLNLMGEEKYTAVRVEWNAYVAVFYGMFTVWFIRSWIKYGLTDTASFCVFLPFYLFGEMAYRFSPNTAISIKDESDYYRSVSFASTALEREVNDKYAGSVQSVKDDGDSVTITFETPYGIRPDWAPFLKILAKELGIPVKYIRTFPLSDRITHIKISKAGLKNYAGHGKYASLWKSSRDVADRILLNYPDSNPIRT